MLSRRHLLLGSGLLVGSSGALAAAVARALAEIAPDITELRATCAGFNGVVPGPVIRARRGDEVRVRLANGLDEPTALCWHGVRMAKGPDGEAAPVTVAPGAKLDYRFTVPDAGTFWYRAARRAQQDAGLYGALIIAEPSPPPVDQDHVLVFDRRQTGSDAIRRWTVNGASTLDLAVRTNERLRLRFLNASAMQMMSARIENHRVMVMALDGEPAEPFASRDSSVVLGPGNRADVFVDATLGPGSIAPVMFAPEGEPPPLRLVYTDAPARTAPLGEPAPLPANPLPERMNFSRALRVTLPIEIGTAAAMGSSQMRSQALFAAERGRTVVMAIDNRDAGARAVHVHGHHFRVLDRLDDGWKPYWLDTVLVLPRQITRIAFVAENPGRWLIEEQALDAPAILERWFEIR